MMRVIKVGGRVQQDPALPAALAHAWRETPGALCVVHGGGDAVSALQRALGGEPEFIAGRRVTSAQDLELVRMAVSGAANKRLVSHLVSAGVAAVGISGEDGALIGARAIDAGRLGRAGAPGVVRAALLRHLLAGGFLPVISPLARDLDRSNGDPLNVNADDAASAIAVALDATELLLVSDVEGVELEGARARTLDAERAVTAIRSGAAHGGMAAKIEAALRALHAGVGVVRIGGIGMLVGGAPGTSLTRAPVAA
jgi:acetylglutamate kinase